MVFERQIYSELLAWKTRKDRKPLVLRGARQVGKTTIINALAETYKYTLLLNLERPAHKAFFEDFEDVEQILEAIRIYFNVPKNSNEDTLLFIDEIQESPKALQFLRYFYEDIPKLHVIGAGSLLEFAMEKIGNLPVGRVEYMYIHPFNFEEYLSALGYTELLESLREIPSAGISHKLLLELFHRFAIIGGMPEIIHVDIQDKNISDLARIYDSIWVTYKSDIEKYASNNTERNVLRHIMESAPFFLDQRIKFQGFGNSNYRSREVGEAFRNLDNARVIRLIYPTTDVEPPVRKDLKKSPRMQFLDVGLINYSIGIQGDLISMEDLSNAYKGALIPQIVYQELISKQINSSNLPYFWVREKSQSSAEVDLVKEYKNMVIPIEIKSGSSGSLKSLHQFMDKVEHPYAVRIYAGSMKIEHTNTPSGKPYILLNLPYYMGTILDKYVHWFVENN